MPRRPRPTNEEAIRLADGLNAAELQYARDTLRTLQSKAGFYYKLGDEHYKQGRLKEAKGDYEEAIRLADGLSAAQLKYARRMVRWIAREIDQ